MALDLLAYQLMRDSAWVRAQREALARGEAPACPVDGCDGWLRPFRLDAVDAATSSERAAVGGVCCGSCGARSRPVVP